MQISHKKTFFCAFKSTAVYATMKNYQQTNSTIEEGYYYNNKSQHACSESVEKHLSLHAF